MDELILFMKERVADIERQADEHPSLEQQLRADANAKRRIIKYCAEWQRADENSDNDFTTGAWAACMHILKLLVAPSTDHSAFQSEWRV